MLKSLHGALVALFWGFFTAEFRDFISKIQRKVKAHNITIPSSSRPTQITMGVREEEKLKDFTLKRLLY